MQIVIDVPEKDVPNSQEIMTINLHFIAGEVCECSYPYMVLPKGHGRLIDESKIKIVSTWDNGYANCDAPTIIEADITAEMPTTKCIRCGKEIKPGEYVRLGCCKSCEEIVEEKKRVWIANNSNYLG